MRSFDPIEVVPKVAAGVLLIVFEVCGFAVFPDAVCPHAAVAFLTTLKSVPVEPQGILQRDPLPSAPDFDLACVAYFRHEAEYEPSGLARKPYSGLPYSN